MLSVVQGVLLRTHKEVLSRFSAGGPGTTGLPAWDIRLVLSFLRSQAIILTQLGRDDACLSDFPLTVSNKSQPGDSSWRGIFAKAGSRWPSVDCLS